MLHAVIMAGGSGTRFWPLSRNDVPKQLLNLSGERTMIQQAVDRCQDLIPAARTWVVTNERQSRLTQEQLPDLAKQNFLIEPFARNTAACIGLAAVHLLRDDPEALMLVMPADHVIAPVSRFQQAVKLAEGLVLEQPELLTLFGAVPFFPSTGFGYIERGTLLSSSRSAVYRVVSFREKPDYATASQYLKSGHFFWNCGIFVWHARTILELLKQYQPEIAACLQRIQAAIGQPHYQALLTEEYRNCPSISIDYAVLEQAKQIAVVEALFDWDDVGSWQSLHRLQGVDNCGNTIVGQHLGIETHKCIIRSTDQHLVATLGMKNCIIVHTPDVTLVADKSDENAIKTLIETLRAQGLENLL